MQFIDGVEDAEQLGLVLDRPAQARHLTVLTVVPAGHLQPTEATFPRSEVALDIDPVGVGGMRGCLLDHDVRFPSKRALPDLPGRGSAPLNKAAGSALPCGDLTFLFFKCPSHRRSNASPVLGVMRGSAAQSDRQGRAGGLSSCIGVEWPDRKSLTGFD